jgi:hypothetical protein
VIKVPKYDIEVKLVGTDGNAYALMGKVRKALRQAGASPEELDQFFQEATSGDYDHLIYVCTEWVNVT